MVYVFIKSVANDATDGVIDSYHRIDQEFSNDPELRQQKMNDLLVRALEDYVLPVPWERVVTGIAEFDYDSTEPGSDRIIIQHGPLLVVIDAWDQYLDFYYQTTDDEYQAAFEEEQERLAATNAPRSPFA